MIKVVEKLGEFLSFQNVLEDSENQHKAMFNNSDVVFLKNQVH